MRNRSMILFLIACLLGTPVVVHAYHASQHCAAVTGQTDAPAFGASDPAGVCRTLDPDPLWARFFGVLSLAALVASGIGLARGLAGRRQERDLLAGAGIRVNESDLPLED